MKKAVFLAVVLVMAFCTPFAHAGAGRILNMGVEAASQASSGYNGYSDAQEETDSGISDAATDGAVTAGIVAANVVSASAAGAGSLAGYAGIASAVSSMGLGGVTTAIAGAMGSSATGAAATAVVTCAVGGQVIGAILTQGLQRSVTAFIKAVRHCSGGSENEMSDGCPAFGASTSRKGRRSQMKKAIDSAMVLVLVGTSHCFGGAAEKNRVLERQYTLTAKKSNYLSRRYGLSCTRTVACD